MDRPTSLDGWVDLLQGRPLPLLQNSRDTLQRLDFDNITTARLSNIALTDPGLTLTILRSAVLRPSKRLQGEILTLDSAAMIMGMGAMAALIDQMQVLETVTNDYTRELYLLVVNRTYHGAYQAYGMARIRVDAVPEEIFTAAMLREVGALMLLVHGDNILTAEIIASEEQQLAVLGFTLKQLSQRLAQVWRLSSFIQCSLLDELPANNPRLYEIRLGSDVAHAAERGWEGVEMEQLIEAMARHLRISLKDAQEEIHGCAVQSAQETRFYGVASTATLLPGLNAEERAELQPVNPIVRKIGSGYKGRSSPYTPFTAEDVVEAQASRSDEALAAAIQQLESMLEGVIHLPKLMAGLKTAFYNSLGLNRAFFAMLSPDRKHLVSRFVFGNEQGIRNLRIPIAHGNLFERLLEKPQAIWVKEDNRQKVWPLIPAEINKLFDGEDFFIMTIRIKGKPLGIIYGDRRGSETPLDTIDYEKFRQLGQLLAKGFERLGR